MNHKRLQKEREDRAARGQLKQLLVPSAEIFCVTDPHWWPYQGKTPPEACICHPLAVSINRLFELMLLLFVLIALLGSWIDFSNLSQPQKGLYKYSRDLVRRCRRARHRVTGNLDIMRSSLSFNPGECSIYSQANCKQIRLKHKILHYTDLGKVTVKGEVRLTVNTAAMGIAAFMKTVSRTGTISVTLHLVNAHFKSK